MIDFTCLNNLNNLLFLFLNVIIIIIIIIFFPSFLSDSPYHAKTQPNGSTHSAKDKEVIILNTPQQEQEYHHHHLFTELGFLTCSRDETVQNLYDKVAKMIYNKRKEIFSDVLNDNTVIDKGFNETENYIYS